MLKIILFTTIIALLSCEMSVECKCTADQEPETESDSEPEAEESSIALGTILDTERMYAIDDGSSELNNMFISDLPKNGNDSRNITAMISESTTITLKIDNGQGNISSTVVTYNSTDPSPNNKSFNSLNDLISELNNASMDNGTGTGTNLVFSTATDPIVGTGGYLQLANVTDEMTVTFESSNPSLNLALTTLNVTGAESGGAPTVQAPTHTRYRFNHIAKGSDLLTHLVDKSGRLLGMIADDIITVSGRVGGRIIDNGGTPSVLPQILSSPTGAVVTSFGGGIANNYQEFVNNITRFFKLINDAGVIIDSDGSMKIYGEVGLVNELSNFHITADTPVPSSPARLSIFNNMFDASSGNYITVQKAKDATN